jgi:prepilin-type N-terminal cleavage/methylation domain-containing protein
MGPVQYISGMKLRDEAKPGFTLVEIAIALAIIAVMTATLAVWYGSFSSRPMISQIEHNVQTVATQIRYFRDDVGAYPSSITELVSQPGVASTTSCGTSFDALKVSRWRGPYLPGNLGSTRIVVETDTIRDALIRVPTTATSRDDPGVLQIEVGNTTLANAMALDSLLDGDASSSTGSVIWGIVGGKQRMAYQIPIAGC